MSDAETHTPPRIRYLDALRVYAVFLVVVIHVSGQILTSEQADLAGISWWAANFYEAFARHCVPIFVMVSGLLLLSSPNSVLLSRFFRKRLSRIVVPLMFWSVIYLVMLALANGDSFRDIPFGDILQRGGFYHLWFLYMLLGLYFATPILRIYVTGADNRSLQYLILLWVIVVAVVPLFNVLSGLEFGVDFVVTTGYVGYFVLGYALRDFQLPRQRRIVLAAVVVVGTVFTATLHYWGNTSGNQSLAEYAYSYLSVFAIAISVAVFLLFKSVNFELLFTKYPVIQRALIRLSAYSFGVYLIHPLFIEILSERLPGVQIDANLIHPLVGIPITALLVFMLSNIAVGIMHQIPFLKWTV